MATIHSVQHLDEETVRRHRERQLKRLAPDCLFELRDVTIVRKERHVRSRYFIAVARAGSERTWRVVELSGPIRHSIANGAPVGTGLTLTIGIHDTVHVIAGGA